MLIRRSFIISLLYFRLGIISYVGSIIIKKHSVVNNVIYVEALLVLKDLGGTCGTVFSVSKGLTFREKDNLI